MNEQTLFTEALEIADPAERAAFLDRVCAGDAGLRARLERLLAQSDRAGSFLERPVAAPAGELAPPPGDETATQPRAPGSLGTVVRPNEAPVAEDGPGTVIGPYKLLQQLGEGGMGAVYLAEQTRPVQRKVAIKLIKAGMDSHAFLARFEAERQALALMDHPNIARVLDAGTTAGGSPFFVMELIKGVPITKYCDNHHLTCAERLGLFVQVCQAVQHAHQKGIIHRDIKPSNVMVCLYDGKPVPKVIDFGVAKATGAKLTDRTLFTAVGAVVGTLEYMSPEQAEVNQLDVDTRSDIYSLGVLFYELLTGTTPLERKRCKSSSFLEVLRLIREEEPQRPSTRLSTIKELLSVAANRGLEPRRLSGVVRGELDWIAMKALEKDRNRRYETANGFAADVQRYLNDEPVQACPPSAAYRFRKFARRNRPALVTATAAALTVVTAVIGLGVSNFLIAREQRATANALHAETRARDDLEHALERERREAYFRRIALAHGALAVNNLGAALGLLEDCPEELRGWEWRYLMRLCRVEPVVVRDGRPVHGIAFGPGGGHLASAGGDGAVRVWDARTGTLVRELPGAHRVFVCSVAFHADGRHLASVGADKLVKVWDWTTGEQVFERPCDAVHPFGTAYAAAFSPLAPGHLAVGCDGTVTIWDWRNKKPVHAFPGHETDRISVAFSPDGRRLATGDWRGRIKIWEIPSGFAEGTSSAKPEGIAVTGGGPLHSFTRAGEARHPVSALAFDPSGTRLAAASFDRALDVWDTSTGRCLLTIPHPGELVLGTAFSPDGRLLASVGEDKTVRVWEVPAAKPEGFAATSRELLTLRGHAAMCGCVAFSPDGLRLASASGDGTIRLWDATPLRGDERQDAAPPFTEHGVEVWSLAPGPDGPGGQKVVSGGFGPPVMVWEVPSAKPEGFAKSREVSARFSGHEVVVFCVAWHPGGRRFASAGSGGGQFSVKVYDATTRDELYTLPATSRPEFFAVAFSPDGRHLVTGRGDGTVQVWDATDGQPIRTLGTHVGPARGVAFSRDGEHLISVGGDGVKLWDATRLGEKQEPQKPLRTFPTHVPGPCLNAAFSPDGKWLAIGDKDYEVVIRDVQTGEARRTLRGHNGDVYTVAFSPDGRRVASAGEDSTVKVWDSETGRLIRTFRGHTGLVTSLAFTSDGKSLVSASRDRTVRFWDVSQLEDRSGPSRQWTEPQRTEPQRSEDSQIRAPTE